MKIIAFNRTPGMPVTDRPQITLHPSSALIGANKPFFVPDFGGEWSGRPAVAVRLCRLGKSIDRQFAPRYFDAVAPAVIFESATMMSDTALTGLCAAIDGTVAIAPWQELPSDPDAEMAMEWNGTSVTLPNILADAADAVSSLSRYTMIQMGDALLPFSLPLTAAATPESRLTVSLGNGSPFTVRVK